MTKIGFGGSCHWCTEAIFQSLKSVDEVQQGWIATDGADFSEAVIVAFDETIISLETLIEIHLATHSCTAEHSMRSKYRSAVYVFEDNQIETANRAIKTLQKDYAEPIITQVLPFKEFKLNREEYLNYYYSNPQKPFCENIIQPKLNLLLQKFAKQM